MNKTLAELIKRKTLNTNRILDALATTDNESHFGSLIVENAAHRIHRHPIADGNMPEPAPLSDDKWAGCHSMIMLEVDANMESSRNPKS
jgi:hypothetical protein